MESLRYNIKALSIIVFVFLVAGGWFVKTEYFDKPTLITITGEGKVAVVPTMVKFTVAVTNYNQSSVLALSDNQTLVKDLRALLKQAGAKDQDIIVSYARLVPPQAAYNQNQYQAVNSMDVTLKNLIGFDKLIGALYAGGAASVSNIVFTTENSQTLEKQAVTQAVEDAKGRAKEIARSLAKRVGRMVSVSTVEVGEAGALAGQSKDQIGGGASPSQIEIVRQASIVFELR